jgi:hypothetical protein
LVSGGQLKVIWPLLRVMEVPQMQEHGTARGHGRKENGNGKDKGQRDRRGGWGWGLEGRSPEKRLIFQDSSNFTFFREFTQALTFSLI